MTTTDAILTRRSIRKFKPGEITKEQLKTILNAAMHAPSACNTRPWSFIVVTDRTQMDKLYEIIPQEHFKQAAAAIVITALPERAAKCPGHHLGDCGAAAQNILLQAWELGIGTVWCGLQANKDREAAARQVFDIPESAIPFCAIAMGIPDETPAAKGKYEEELVHWDKW